GLGGLLGRGVVGDTFGQEAAGARKELLGGRPTAFGRNGDGGGQDLEHPGHVLRVRGDGGRIGGAGRPRGGGRGGDPPAGAAPVPRPRGGRGAVASGPRPAPPRPRPRSPWARPSPPPAPPRRHRSAVARSSWISASMRSARAASSRPGSSGRGSPSEP